MSVPQGIKDRVNKMIEDLTAMMKDEKYEIMCADSEDKHHDWISRNSLLVDRHFKIDVRLRDKNASATFDEEKDD